MNSDGISVHDKLSAYIKSKKMRNTPERFAILDKALLLRPHFDIESLYNAIISDYHVSRSTVYNTVTLMCEAGILRRNFLGNTMAHYEFINENNIHLICIRCGVIKTITDDGTCSDIVAKKFRGFRPEFASVSINGLCSACARKRKNKSNPKH